MEVACITTGITCVIGSGNIACNGIIEQIGICDASVTGQVERGYNQCIVPDVKCKRILHVDAATAGLITKPVHFK